MAMDRPGPLRLSLFLAVGIAAVSCGAVLVRLAAAPALVVAAYRVSWATCLLAPFLIPGPVREFRSISWQDWRNLALSGIALALHFALWIASLSYTSVASSVLLVDTTPFFIGFASQWILRRPCGRAFWIGLTVAFLGCVVVFHGDWSESSASLRGNLLALGGAVAVAVYLMIGSTARRRLSLLAYVWPVYFTAALTLALAAVVAGVPLHGLPARTHLFMFLVGLVPQCIGHTTYNWSLRWLAPGLVALIGLAEPIGASLLAYFFLNERLTAAKGLGGCLILLGIYLATSRRVGK
jgi:drug/metabolite transporter (DMT)-like permease